MIKKLSLFFVTLFVLLISTCAVNAQTTKYKCMIQMTNYIGDGAYVAVSLIDPKGNYEKTLYVMGSDKKWYSSLKSWYKFYSKKPTNISATTGASVTGGDRSVTTIEIENSKLNAGYKLRFETAVEDKNYNEKDLEVPLTTEGMSAKTEGAGTGYIRYVRFSAN